MLPSSELRAILTHVVGGYIRLEDCTETQRACVDNLIRQRLTGMPLAKIIGYKEFWKHRFITTKNTLDPRPDSETLIEAVLKTYPPTGFPDILVKSVSTRIQNADLDISSATCNLVREPSSVKPYRILDLGTGTGCLLISLLTEYPDARGVGVDISNKALEIAKRNADVILGIGRHPRQEHNSGPRTHLINCSNNRDCSLDDKHHPEYSTVNGSSIMSYALAEDDSRVTWIQSNWCEKLSGTFDIIVCNPPYIDPSEPINEGASFDPPVALYGGVHTYETILKSIDKHLACRPKHLFFEIGYTQATAVSKLLQCYSYHDIQIFKDLSGHNRIIHACV